MNPSIMLHHRGIAQVFGEFAQTFRSRVPTWLLLAFALFPCLTWYLRRLNDGSDEPYGLIPLLLAGVFAWRDRHYLTASSMARSAGALMVLISVMLIPSAPPMIRAIVGICGTGLLLGLHVRPGVLGLLLLSLPLVASLQFYAGYPLRIATAECATQLLKGCGIVVARDGVGIEIAGTMVGVDPACSGVRMLWLGLIAAMALAAYHRVSWLATAVAAFSAMLLVIPANVARATWLTLVESGRVSDAGIGHTGIGLLAFLIILLPLTILIPRHSRPNSDVQASGQSPIARPLLVCACLMAPILMLRPSSLEAEPVLLGSMPDTLSFAGITLPLEPLPLSPEESAFLRSFPGTLGVFRRGEDQVILRRVTKATRRLHPSADCLRASGYATGDSITVRHADGSTWAMFHATKDGQRLTVHERIVSEQNANTWTDVPAWYWSALRRPLNGPWRAETVISR